MGSVDVSDVSRVDHCRERFGWISGTLIMNFSETADLDALIAEAEGEMFKVAPSPTLSDAALGDTFGEASFSSWGALSPGNHFDSGHLTSPGSPHLPDAPVRHPAHRRPPVPPRISCEGLHRDCMSPVSRLITDAERAMFSDSMSPYQSPGESVSPAAINMLDSALLRDLSFSQGAPNLGAKHREELFSWQGGGTDQYLHDAELQELDESELDELNCTVPLTTPGSGVFSGGKARGAMGAVRWRPLEVMESRTVRQVVFGAPNKQFSQSWCQGLIWSTAIRFGLHQEGGGPCGLLAAVQAQFVVQLQKNAPQAGASRSNWKWILQLESSTRTQWLVAALADILWRVRSSIELRVATLSRHAEAELIEAYGSGGPNAASAGAVDAFASKVSVACVQQRSALLEVLQECVEGAWSRKFGLQLLIYSLLLTRGAPNIQAEMDQGGSMIGKFGYCTQELMNLLLTGVASSNTFNGEIDLSGMKFGGVEARSEVGYLTLHEWYEDVQVGPFLKDPVYPVWVVHSESHFSCLFQPEFVRQAAAQHGDAQAVQLLYYDGLARQSLPILLSVAPGNLQRDDSAPPLERVICTKWPKSIVDWNGSEKIL